jgi:WD40 repeat protein
MIGSDNKYAISAGLDDTIRVWNIETKMQEAIFKSNTFHLQSLAMTMMKSMLFVALKIILLEYLSLQRKI